MIAAAIGGKKSKKGKTENKMRKAIGQAPLKQEEGADTSFLGSLHLVKKVEELAWKNGGHPVVTQGCPTPQLRDKVLINFYNLLRQEAQQDATGRAGRVYTKAAQQMPDAALLYPRMAAVCSIANWRAMKWPKLPVDAPDCVRLFALGNEEDWNFARHLVTGATAEVGTYMVFCNTHQEVLAKVEATAIITVDGTFRTAPTGWYQVVYFHAEAVGILKVFVAVFLTGKSRELYNVAFASLKNVLPGACRPTNTMSDFEDALSGAVVAMFPGSRTDFCYFHYAQVCKKCPFESYPN
jgi:hypothetical protein